MTKFEPGDTVTLTSERRFFAARILAGERGTVVRSTPSLVHATANGGGYDVVVRFRRPLPSAVINAHAEAMRELGISEQYIAVHADEVLVRSTNLVPVQLVKEVQA